MTKYTDDYFVTCRCCNQKINVKNIGSAYVREDATIAKCKVCSWLIRNKEKVENIKKYSQELIRRILDFFYNQDNVCISDFSNIENISIEYAIDLFQLLKVSKKKVIVKAECECCSKPISYSPSAYKQNKNHYCSYECYWEDKTNKIPHGKDSQFYNRVDVNCTNCGKDISKIPYSYKKKNAFGDSHNFCCYQCYWDFRKKYYVGEKSVNWHRKYTKEQHDKMAITAVNNARKTKTRDTKIQLAINDILEKHNIQYEREYMIGYMQIDNYLKDYNLMIEVQGDYWHVNPQKYNKDGLLINDTQVKDIIQDKKKNTLLKNKGINILYIWEFDIKNNISMCENLILKYINDNGNLDNYNSFNWEYENNNLKLKDNIIYSYQELPCDEYKNIIKKKAG